MRKALIAGIIMVIVLLVVTVFFSVAYLMPISLGAPSLKVELAPHAPWNAQTGSPLRFNVTLGNEAWLFAAARNVRVAISVPKNFTICRQGTNEYNFTINTLRGGETRDNALNLTAPWIVSQQNYNVTIRITADNAAEQTLMVPIKVSQTTYYTHPP